MLHVTVVCAVMQAKLIAMQILFRTIQQCIWGPAASNLPSSHQWQECMRVLHHQTLSMPSQQLRSCKLAICLWWQKALKGSSAAVCRVQATISDHCQQADHQAQVPSSIHRASRTGGDVSCELPVNGSQMGFVAKQSKPLLVHPPVIGDESTSSIWHESTSSIWPESIEHHYVHMYPSMEGPLTLMKQLSLHGMS